MIPFAVARISTWASYIQALPEFFFLPLLFTDFVSHILIANLSLY